MAKQIIPSELKTLMLEQMIESVTEPANTAYYAFLGDHQSTGSIESDVSEPTESARYLTVNTFRNMMFGKRMDSNSMKLMIPRHDWESDTVFTMYDDIDTNLYDKNFYAVVNDESYYYVWKCLYNANGAPSTTSPDYAHIANTSSGYYETSDGYQWKYMYKVDSNTFNTFTTQEFIPVATDDTVSEIAKNGSIDVIKVDTHGKNYNNYTSGNFGGSGALDATYANNVNYRLPPSSTQSTVEGFYGNTILTFTDGTGAGQYRRVLNSNSGANGVILHIESAFDELPDSTTFFEVSPEIAIYSDGNQTVNAIARAIINANASNSVHKIEMLEVGENYNYATAEVLTGQFANSSLGSGGSAIVEPTPASVRPILPPQGGHGANTSIELGATTIGVYNKFVDDENGLTIPTNTFSQFGVIRDPKFNNVKIGVVSPYNSEVPGSVGSFTIGEEFKQFRRLEIQGDVSIVASNNTVVSDGTPHFDSFLQVGDELYIANHNVPGRQFSTTVQSVVNSTAITISSTPNWTDTAEMYYTKTVANGVIASSDYSNNDYKYVYLDSVQGEIIKDQMIVGLSSNSIANVVSIDINGRIGTVDAEWDWDSYNQMIKIVSTDIPLFNQDEIVYQGNTFAGRVHSSNSTHLFLTQTEGILQTNTSLSGLLSGLSLDSGFTKYNGDIDPTSGSIIYLQNDVAVSRANNQTEEILVIMEF